ncbi:MAG: hypothetical protein FWE74_02825 [Oscillospiraceae bacterium]|nr:hypothetical protein [Oscillospiraceae bacterium]
MKNNNSYEQNYDERQQQIRAKVYRHGFIAAIVILILDAMLAIMGVFWAPTFFRNVIIVTFINSIVCAEFIFRGVFFVKKNERITYMASFSAASIILLVMLRRHIIEGANIMENGELSEFGCSFVIALLFLLNALCALIQIFREKRVNREESLDINDLP